MNRCTIRTPRPVLAGLGWLLGAVLALSPGWARADLTPDQQVELRNSSAQLADPARSAKTKLEAAELLLTRDYPEATDALVGFLADASNRAAQVAVAEGVARLGVGQKAFVEPLMTMLASRDAVVRSAAARALASYNDPKVAEKLIELAGDRSAELAMRLDAISALSRLLNKNAVDVLVHLLDDPEPAVRVAAAEGLSRMTSIRAFGTSSRQWQQWWRENKDKPRSEWLVDLANSMLKAKASLEIENRHLRERLVAAMAELYAATPAQRRDALLIGLLKDPLPEVRRVGLRLVERRVASAESVNDDVRAMVAALIRDSDPRVRAEAAPLLASVDSDRATELLLGRLSSEEDSSVREALLNALGQLQDAQAAGPLVAELASPEASVVAAASRALARVAEKAPLGEDLARRATRVLVERYQQFDADAASPPEAREAILTAMGALASEAFIPVMRRALQDRSALVRLAAVNGLVRLGRGDLADDVAALADDSDRGVRQAVIVALGALDGRDHLDVFLQLSGPAESDPAVRKQAWEAVMAVLGDSDAATISRVAEQLADRPDAGSQRLEALELLVASLRASGSDDLPGGLAQLGRELLAANRPIEAALHLGEAFAALAEAKSFQAPAVHAGWLAALLAGPDPRAGDALARAPDAASFQAGFAAASERLGELGEQGRWSDALALLDAIAKAAAERLSEKQQAELAAWAAKARKGQADKDFRNAQALVAKLTNGEEKTRTAAAEELQKMGPRAMPALLDRLAAAVGGERPSPEVEQAVLAVIRRIEPERKGYDPSAPVDERLELIRRWQGQNGS